MSDNAAERKRWKIDTLSNTVIENNCSHVLSIFVVISVTHFIHSSCYANINVHADYAREARLRNYVIVSPLNKRLYTSNFVALLAIYPCDVVVNHVMFTWKIGMLLLSPLLCSQCYSTSVMDENRPLLKRSRVVLHLRRTRSPRSRSVFTCFCLLLLLVGAVRNYAVENAFADRVRLLSYSYTWSNPYYFDYNSSSRFPSNRSASNAGSYGDRRNNLNATNNSLPQGQPQQQLQLQHRHELSDIRSKNSTAKSSNATLIRTPQKRVYKGVKLPGMPFHSLPSRKSFSDDAPEFVDSSLDDNKLPPLHDDTKDSVYPTTTWGDAAIQSKTDLIHGRASQANKELFKNLPKKETKQEAPAKYNGNRGEKESTESEENESHFKQQNNSEVETDEKLLEDNVNKETETQVNVGTVKKGAHVDKMRQHEKAEMKANTGNIEKKQHHYEEVNGSQEKATLKQTDTPHVVLTSAGNSTIAEHEEEMDGSVSDINQSENEEKSTRSETKPKIFEHHVHPADHYDEEARAELTRNITRSGAKLQATTETATYPWTVFKFESSTPESMSQWQDKPILRQKTIDSLKKLESVYITDYVKWHRSVIDKVKSGRISGESVRTLVYRGKEGMGDRMRGAIHAFLCAMLTERLLLIDWVQPYPLNVAVELGVGTNFTQDPYYFGTGTGLDYEIAPFGKHPTIKDLRALLDKQANWVAMTKETRPCMKFLLVDVPFHYPKLKAVKRLGKLPRHPWPTEFFPLVFRALFKATPALRDGVEEFITSGNDISRPFIGIHVRLGGDTKESKSKRFRTKLTLHESAMCAAVTALEMAKARGISPPRFFLACDTVAFRTALRAAVRRNDPTAIMMFGDWKVKHVRHLDATNEDDYDAFLSTFVDLLVLSHADSLLHMRSGFANLARWMGGIEPQFIFHNTNCLRVS